MIVEINHKLVWTQFYDQQNEISDREYEINYCSKEYTHNGKLFIITLKNDVKTQE